MTRWLEQDEQATWRALLTMIGTIQGGVDAQLQSDAGMPHAYYEVLVRLSEAPDRRLRMSALAHVVGASRSRLSHAVAQLESRGWVRREASATDRRGQVAVLTETGFGALEQAAPGHVGAVRGLVFDRLSRTQVAQLRDIAVAVAGPTG